MGHSGLEVGQERAGWLRQRVFPGESLNYHRKLKILLEHLKFDELLIASVFT